MCESRAHSSIPVAKSTLKYLVTTSILFLVHVGDASCSQNIEVTYSSSFFFIRLEILLSLQKLLELHALPPLLLLGT